MIVILFFFPDALFSALIWEFFTFWKIPWYSLHSSGNFSNSEKFPDSLVGEMIVIPFLCELFGFWKIHWYPVLLAHLGIFHILKNFLIHLHFSSHSSGNLSNSEKFPDSLVLNHGICHETYKGKLTDNSSDSGLCMVIYSSELARFPEKVLINSGIDTLIHDMIQKNHDQSLVKQMQNEITSLMLALSKKFSSHDSNDTLVIHSSLFDSILVVLKLIVVCSSSPLSLSSSTSLLSSSWLSCYMNHAMSNKGGRGRWTTESMRRGEGVLGRWKTN